MVYPTTGYMAYEVSTPITLLHHLLHTVQSAAAVRDVFTFLSSSSGLIVHFLLRPWYLTTTEPDCMTPCTSPATPMYYTHADTQTHVTHMLLATTVLRPGLFPGPPG